MTYCSRTTIEYHDGQDIYNTRLGLRSFEGQRKYPVKVENCALLKFRLLTFVFGEFRSLQQVPTVLDDNRQREDHKKQEVSQSELQEAGEDHKQKTVLDDNAAGRPQVR